MSKRILITGSGGFVGFNLSNLLISQGHEIVGIDNAHDDGDIAIKNQRIERLNALKNYTAHIGSVTDKQFIDDVFSKEHVDAVVHLAALANIRESAEMPHLYTETNFMSALNVLDQCHKHKINRFLFASSSSVYGESSGYRKEGENIGEPLSIYAASKGAAEQICYTYSHLYKLNIGVMRFFTVYGPWGRPNMLILSLIKRVDTGEKVPIFGTGDATRTFIYIDDLTDAIQILLKNGNGYQTFNFAGTECVSVNNAVELVEQALGKSANVVNLPANPNDASDSSGDISHAKNTLNWQPKHSIKEGIAKTVRWYLDNRDWLINAVPSVKI